MALITSLDPKNYSEIKITYANSIKVDITVDDVQIVELYDTGLIVLTYKDGSIKTYSSVASFFLKTKTP